MNILLVEDNPGDAKLLRLMLMDAETSFEFTHTHRLSDALLKIDFMSESKQFDVILLDLSLPDSQGIDTFLHIQSQAPEIPVVVLTGLDDLALASKLALAGAQDYLVKGYVDSSLLLRSIHYAIERKKTVENLRLAAKVFECVLEAIVITDAASQIVNINRAFTKITGYSQEAAVGQHVAQLLRSEKHSEEFVQALWQGIQKNGQWQDEVWNRRKSGEIFPSWMSISEVRNAKGTLVNYVTVFTDISNIKLSEERFRHLAHHDTLTGLPNRLFFNDRLNQAILHANRLKTGVAVMFIDLDRFKTINDTLGHACGDLLLQSVAKRLVSCIRESDSVGRLGGDEFAIILSDIGKKEDIDTIAQKILDTLSEPLLLEGNEILSSASIGIAYHSSTHSSADKLLEQADMAMYHAKGMGRNVFQYYSMEMGNETYERLEFELSVRKALERDEFVMYYQPQMQLDNKEIIGVEALLRWKHPTRGLVQTSDFIPLLEETGLIIPVGEWVLKTACRQCKAWMDAGSPSVGVAINLTAKQFKHKDIAELIGRILVETGMPPQFLELELSKHIVMENQEKSLSTIRHIKDLGVRIAIDDFGTGASSLNTINRLKIDTLKIDRSLLMNIEEDGDSAIFAKLLLSLAQNLHLRSVAEGVETPEQLAFLLKNQCTEVQGFLFSHPMPAEELSSLLKNQIRIKTATQ